MKTTTTLNEYVSAELHKKGYNEFYNGGHFTGFDKEHSFMNLILTYAEPVKTIMSEFFLGFSFSDESLNDMFQRAFLMKFQNREFRYQTPEDVQAELSYYMLTHAVEIETLFSSYTKMLTKTSESTTSATGKTQRDNRSMTSRFPDSQVNMNLNDETMDFADSNSIGKDVSNNDNNSHTESTSYDPDAYLKFSGIWTKYFNELDQLCFLQKW